MCLRQKTEIPGKMVHDRAGQKTPSDDNLIPLLSTSPEKVIISLKGE